MKILELARQGIGRMIAAREKRLFKSRAHELNDCLVELFQNEALRRELVAQDIRHVTLVNGCYETLALAPFNRISWMGVGRMLYRGNTVDGYSDHPVRLIGEKLFFEDVEGVFRLGEYMAREGSPLYSTPGKIRDRMEPVARVLDTRSRLVG